MHELTIFTTAPTRLELHFLTISHSSLTTAAPVTMSDELEGKLISLAADILIDNLVQGEEQGHKIKVRMLKVLLVY